MNYKILKFPKGKDKFDFLYFKQYERKSEESQVLTPEEEEKTLYVCNFTQALDIGLLKKYLGVCGPIDQIKTGEHFSRSGNKKKR